jgi:hypothetical protein
VGIWPISSRWNVDTNISCELNLNYYYIADSVTDVLTDIVILCLPLPMVKRLRMSGTQRASCRGVRCYSQTHYKLRTANAGFQLVKASANALEAMANDFNCSRQLEFPVCQQPLECGKQVRSAWLAVDSSAKDGTVLNAVRSLVNVAARNHLGERLRAREDFKQRRVDRDPVDRI